MTPRVSGAGVIFVRNASIRGLTTAAGVWATAGVGIAIGSGMYFIGVFSALLIIVIQLVLHKYMKHIDNTVASEINVTMSNADASIDKLQALLESNNIKVQSYRFTRNADSTVTFILLVRTIADDINFEKSIQFIKDEPTVLSMSIDDITL